MSKAERDGNHALARRLQSSLYPTQHAVQPMNTTFDFQPVYPRHDLMIEIGKTQMAMEHLAARSEQDRQKLRPRLESHMHRLRNALSQLAA
jgi:hypothetical protein